MQKRLNLRRDLLLLFALTAALLAFPAVADHSKGNVDEVRLGDAIDASGEVAPDTAKDHFPPRTPIYITMQVQEAPKGTALLVNVLDRETEELAWSGEQQVPGGHAVMSFLIEPGELNEGKYRARVKLGDDWVAEEEFKVEK
jgi:hypothetical protein